MHSTPEFINLPPEVRDLMANYEKQYRGTSTGIPTGRMWDEIRSLLLKLPTPPQPAPTGPGWYYGRVKGIEDQPPHPIHVVHTSKTIDAMLRAELYLSLHNLDRFDWFGPVPECVA